MSRLLGLGLALFALLWPVASAQADDPAEYSSDLDAALLAIEEAELRERMITALAVAEGLRLRGRTVLVALTELTRVRRALADLSPTDPRRSALEARLTSLEQRQDEVSAVVEDEFRSYVGIVSDISTDLWPRLRRVGADLEADLLARNLERLNDLLPLLQTHVEEMNRSENLAPDALERWRTEIDDTYDLRRQRRENPLGSGPYADPSAKSDRDI
ncbi:MAG: hypothetical protein AAGI34_00170 [Pseudomonadota bacterium]